MSMINRIVESMMTADEQVELMRLEDEVTDATDQLEFAIENLNKSRDVSSHAVILGHVDHVCDCKHDQYVCQNNLNKYIEQISKDVVARIMTTDV